MEITLIIRELLAKHTYISLPTIGSFVQKYEPAHISNDGITFIPPKQSIIFDTSRSFNDEAIENYICDKLGIDQHKASDILTEFIGKVKEDLSIGKKIVFENVGSLSKDEKGGIVFTQVQDDSLASPTYGLNEIEVAPKVTEKIKQKENAVVAAEIPERKSNTTRILVSLVIAFIVVVIASTLILVPELRFWSSKSTSVEGKIDNKDTSTQQVPENKLAQDIQKPDSLPSKKDSLESKVDQTIKDKTEKKAALYYQEQKVQEHKTYYLIVGSFGKVENAQKLIEDYKQKGFVPEIIQGNGMFRVSINKTTDKNIALKEYNKFHSENPNESAWILAI